MSTEEASTARHRLAQIAKTAYSATTGPQRPLDHLETVARLRWLLDQAETELVAAARDEGRNWGKIGRALGITRQSARERFAKPSAPRSDVDQMMLWPYEPTNTASPNELPAGVGQTMPGPPTDA